MRESRLTKITSLMNDFLPPPYGGGMEITCTFSIPPRELVSFDSMNRSELQGHLTERILREYEKAERFRKRIHRRRKLLRRPVRV